MLEKSRPQHLNETRQSAGFIKEVGAGQETMRQREGSLPMTLEETMALALEE
ncbi:MAG TPA: hypothetical protein VF896_08755 [Anaerolineales bacterium]